MTALAFRRRSLRFFPQALAEIDAPMLDRPSPVQPQSSNSPVLTNEKNHVSDRRTGSLSQLRRNLGPVVEMGRDVLGNIYASIARVVLERAEAFEDQRAERKARQRIAARTAGRPRPARETPLASAGTGLKTRSASASKFGV